MMRTGFRKLYFFSYFLGFENNRKMLPMEKNQSLLNWKVSQPPPYAQQKSARSCSQLELSVSPELEEYTHRRNEFEKQIF